MKQARKVLCIISVGITVVLLAVSTVYACCGMFPEITDDPVEPGCPGDPVTISGTITGTVWPDGNYTTDAEVIVEVTAPSGDETTIELTAADGGLSNLQQFPDTGPPYTSATFDFSATYTPPEAGTYTYVKTVGWTSNLGTMYETASGTFVVEECEGVEIDIKPGSCPNPFNAKSKGNVPVAIIGTDSFDVTTIDPASITLEGVAPLKWSIEDVTEPGGYDPEDCFDCFEEPAPIYDTEGNLVWQYAGDGFLDLVLQFDTQALATAIGTVPRDTCVVLTLSGLAGDPAEPFECSDSVIIRTK